MEQSRKDKLLNDVGPSSKNELKTTSAIGESKNHTNIKPVTVLRISESELRKSCKDMQEELATQEVIAKDKTGVDDNSWSVVDCTELLAKLTISNSEMGDKDSSAVTNGPSNVSYSKGNPFLYRTDIAKAHLPGNSDEDEDEDGAGVGLGNGKEEIKHLQTQHSSQDFTEDNQERASSPSNSDGSDEVFTNTSKPASTEIDAGHKNQVLAALHRGEFKKPRRPFKSDSSVISRTESIEASTTLSDTKEGRCNNKSTLARSQSEVATSFEHKNISCGLATETDPVAIVVLNDADKDSKIVSNESKVGDEQDHSTGNVTENWREILPATDNSLGNQDADRSERKDWNESKLSFSTADSDSQEHKNGQSSGTQNWRERPPVDLKESESNNASNENWRERTSDHLGDLWRKGSHLQNWRDRKSISMDESRKDAACNPSFGGSSKRYSTGDIPLERQDSNEKGL